MGKIYFFITEYTLQQILLSLSDLEILLPCIILLIAPLSLDAYMCQAFFCLFVLCVFTYIN